MQTATARPPLYRRRSFILPLLGIVLVVAFAAWTVERSPRFGACIHGHKTDAAYRMMYDGGPIVSRLVRLHLQADCLAAWVGASVR